MAIPKYNKDENESLNTKLFYKDLPPFFKGLIDIIKKESLVSTNMKSIGSSMYDDLPPVFKWSVKMFERMYTGSNTKKPEEYIPSDDSTTKNEEVSSNKKNTDINEDQKHISNNLYKLIMDNITNPETGELDTKKYEDFISGFKSEFNAGMTDFLSTATEVEKEQLKEYIQTGIFEKEFEKYFTSTFNSPNKFLDVTSNNEDNKKSFYEFESEQTYQRETLKKQDELNETVDKIYKLLSGKSTNTSVGQNREDGGFFSNIFGGLNTIIGGAVGGLLTKILGSRSNKPSLPTNTKGGSFGKIVEKLGFKKNPVNPTVSNTTIKNTAKTLMGNGQDVVEKQIQKSAKQNAFKNFARQGLSKIGNALSSGSEFLTNAGSKVGNLFSTGVKTGGQMAANGLRTVGQTIVANPLTTATVGSVVAAGLATKYANEEAAKTKEGQMLLDYGDGTLETGDNFDFEDAGFEYINIKDSGLDAFGKIKDESKYFENLKSKEKEAWEDINYDSVGFKEVASDVSNKELAWEVWHREKFDDKYKNTLKDGKDLSSLKKEFSNAYEKASKLDTYGLYLNRDKLAEKTMNGGDIAIISANQSMKRSSQEVIDSDGNSKFIYNDTIKSDSKQSTAELSQTEDGKFVLSLSGSNLTREMINANDGSITQSTPIDFREFNNDGNFSELRSYEETAEVVGEDGEVQKMKVYLDNVKDSHTFSSISELKDVAPVTNKKIITQEDGFHQNVMSSFLSDIGNYDSQVALDAYAPYKAQIEGAYLQKDESVKNTLIGKIKNNFLKDLSNNSQKFSETKTPLIEVPKVSNTEELTKQSTNPLKNNVYTASSTRGTNQQSQQQAPTIINNNNYNTTNNVSSQQKQQTNPQLLMNPMSPMAWHGSGWGGMR